MSPYVYIIMLLVSTSSLRMSMYANQSGKPRANSYFAQYFCQFPMRTFLKNSDCLSLIFICFIHEISVLYMSWSIQWMKISYCSQWRNVPWDSFVDFFMYVYAVYVYLYLYTVYLYTYSISVYICICGDFEARGSQFQAYCSYFISSTTFSSFLLHYWCLNSGKRHQEKRISYYSSPYYL